MGDPAVGLGIIGLGRWAKVLTRAARKSARLRIVAGYSRSAESRAAYAREFGIPTVDALATLLADPAIQGVILTVPNEHHLPVAAQAAVAGKHVYTEKPIADTLVDGIRLAALAARHSIQLVVGHSARLLAGTRMMKQAIDAGELGRVVFMEGNFSNERALELTPQTWRWYRAKAPGGPLSQLAVHIFDSLHCLGGEIDTVSSHASKLSPVGAEVDDQSMTVLKFADGKREVLALPQTDMFVDELESFADAIATGTPSELSGHNGVVAVAVVNAALRSIDQQGRLVRLADVIAEARSRAIAAAA